MKGTYRVLSYAVAGLVMVQAAVIVFAVAGEGVWISNGGVLDKAKMESRDSFAFPEAVGFMIHGLNGQMLIPLVALVLFVVSFFAKVPGAVKWAGAVLGLVVLQVALGMLLHGLPALGLLHGVNALALFAVAFLAGKRVGKAPQEGVTRSRSDVVA